MADVPSVLVFLDKVDSSKTGAETCISRKSSRSYKTAIVTMLSLARTNDPNDHVIPKNQYYHCTQTAPNTITNKRLWKCNMDRCCLQNSKIELHKLILSLYTDTPSCKHSCCSLDTSEWCSTIYACSCWALSSWTPWVDATKPFVLAWPTTYVCKSVYR